MHKLGIHIEKIVNLSNRIMSAPNHMREHLEAQLVGAARELAEADALPTSAAPVASGDRIEIERAIATKQDLLQLEKDGRKVHELVKSIRELKAKLPAESFSSAGR